MPTYQDLLQLINESKLLKILDSKVKDQVVKRYENAPSEAIAKAYQLITEEESSFLEEKKQKEKALLKATDNLIVKTYAAKKKIKNVQIASNAKEESEEKQQAENILSQL